MGLLILKTVTLSAVTDSISDPRIRIFGTQWHLLNYAAVLIQVAFILSKICRQRPLLCVLVFLVLLTNFSLT